MCTIYFSYQFHPEYPFILLANRDEAYDRPSSGMHLWPGTNIFSGQDLKDGGMWTGISKHGYLGFVTNYRDLNTFQPHLSSRGSLVKSFLLDPINQELYQNHLQNSSDQYNLYNLVYGHYTSLQYFSNVNNEHVAIEPGIHGLSNHLLDTPWFKVTRGKMSLEKLMKSSKPFDFEDLFLILDDQTKSDQNLPVDTGLSEKEEYQLSSTFIEGDRYGTRFQTVLIIDKQGFVQIQEKMLKHNRWHSKKIMFKMEAQYV